MYVHAAPGTDPWMRLIRIYTGIVVLMFPSAFFVQSERNQAQRVGRYCSKHSHNTDKHGSYEWETIWPGRRPLQQVIEITHLPSFSLLLKLRTCASFFFSPSLPAPSTRLLTNNPHVRHTGNKGMTEDRDDPCTSKSCVYGLSRDACSVLGFSSSHFVVTYIRTYPDTADDCNAMINSHMRRHLFHSFPIRE